MRKEIIYFLIFICSSVLVNSISISVYNIGSEHAIINWSSFNESETKSAFVTANGTNFNVDLGKYNLTTNGFICDATGCLNQGNFSNVTWMDDRYVNSDGDIMTGNLTLIGSSVNADGSNFDNVYIGVWGGGSTYASLSHSSFRYTDYGTKYALIQKNDATTYLNGATLNFAILGTRKMVIDSSGKVGIGTTSPSYTLDVSGNTRITSLGVGVAPSGTTGRINANEHILAGGNIYSSGAFGFVLGSSTSQGEYIYKNGDDISIQAGGNKVTTLYGVSKIVDVHHQLNVSKNVVVGQNVSVLGHLDHENWYAEGYWYNSSELPYTITITDADVFYNISRWFQGEVQGFTFEDSGVNVEFDGIYSFSGTLTFTGANGEEYAFAILKDGVPMPDCTIGRTAGVSTRENIGFSCLMSLNQGQHLNFAVKDQNAPGQDINIYHANLNLFQISR